jgi:uncharacterized membrane protein YqhA
MNTRPSEVRSRQPLATVCERALRAALELTAIPVVFLAAAAIGAFVYGAALFVHSTINIARKPFPVGHQIGLFLLDIDIFLIGATLLISAVGLYELFVARPTTGQPSLMPDWLEMRDLNDLKGRVIAMVALVLSVTFVEAVVDSSSARDLLELGGAVAAVIVALTAFLRVTGHAGERP